MSWPKKRKKLITPAPIITAAGQPPVTACHASTAPPRSASHLIFTGRKKNSRSSKSGFR